MTSSPAPAPTSTISQSRNRGKPSLTTFDSLPRELRDQIYGYLVRADEGVVAVSGCATYYGNCKEIQTIRTILHASNSNTQFAREAYEAFFHQNTFQIDSKALPEFVNRKTLQLKNEGFFDVNASIGCLRVIIHEPFGYTSEAQERLANDLRQMLVCPRLHTVSIWIKGCPLKTEEEFNFILRAISEVSTQLREKTGGRFKVYVDGRGKWGNEKRQRLKPWVSSRAGSAWRGASSN